MTSKFFFDNTGINTAIPVLQISDIEYRYSDLSTVFEALGTFDPNLISLSTDKRWSPNFDFYIQNFIFVLFVIRFILSCE